jgi:hypothetical protein
MKKCPQCSTEFEPHNREQVYCNKRCKEGAKRLRRNWPKSDEARLITKLVNTPSSEWETDCIADITPVIIRSLANIAAAELADIQVRVNATKALTAIGRLGLDYKRYIASRPREIAPLVTDEDIAAEDAEFQKIFNPTQPASHPPPNEHTETTKMGDA